MAIRPVAAGEPIFKFGWSIGVATKPIRVGQHVHTQNVKCDHHIDLEAISTDVPAELPRLEGHTFEGFRRADGRVGTRNYLAVISNVNCSASVARMIASRFDQQTLAAFPNVDGVISFRHEGGCAMAFNGSRHRMLSRVLGGMARHPNIGGFLLVGLGCEQGTLDHLVQSQGLHSIAIPGQASGSGDAGQGEAVPVLSIQSAGGTSKTVERGVEIAAGLLKQVNGFQRETVPASHLVLGQSVVVRMAIRASPPILPWGQLPTAWWLAAEPPSFRKPPRFLEQSIFSRDAPALARWRRNCWSESNGGSGTAVITVRSWTTIPPWGTRLEA